MLCPVEKREAFLLQAGMPPQFIAALNSDNLYGSLKYVITAPEASSAYYSSHPKLLSKHPSGTVIPIGQNANADCFYDLVATKAGSYLFISNSIEGSYFEIGSSVESFGNFLAQEAYELNNEMSVREIAQEFVALGFGNPLQQLEELEKFEV